MPQTNTALIGGRLYSVSDQLAFELGSNLYMLMSDSNLSERNLVMLKDILQLPKCEEIVEDKYLQQAAYPLLCVVLNKFLDLKQIGEDLQETVFEKNIDKTNDFLSKAMQTHG